MQRKFIQRILEYYVRKYFIHHPEIRLIAVVGSIGKTSTKRAIAAVLAKKYRVVFHDGNHNTHMSVPLSILDIEYPVAYKKFSAWLPVFAAARRRIKEPTKTDIIIVELGTIRPGNIAHFGSYLRPFLSIITSVTHEHMNAFSDLDAVATEELAVTKFSQNVLINRDNIEYRFDSLLTHNKVSTYGTAPSAEYRLETSNFNMQRGYALSLTSPEHKQPIAATVKVIGQHSLWPVIGAMAVAIKLGLAPNQIAAGLATFHPTPGRMNLIKGKKGIMIIDDSYNANPLSAHAALQTLYELPALQRVAILGSMNELGKVSAIEHERLGLSCDPSMLSWIITVGDVAQKYLAPAARSRGCQVRSFKKSTDAGKFARSKLKRNAVVLVKGSQDKIYTEEAIKVLCYKSDFTKLVRQSEQWMKTKQKFFGEH